MQVTFATFVRSVLNQLRWIVSWTHFDSVRAVGMFKWGTWGLGPPPIFGRDVNPIAIKGQIISECLFDVFKFSKKPTKNLTNFCPESKKWSNHKITAPYSVFNTSNSPYNYKKVPLLC